MKICNTIEYSVYRLYGDYNRQVDTSSSSVYMLHFCLLINSYSHQFLQTSCAESKERDKARESKAGSHMNVDVTVSHLLSVIEVILNFDQIFVIRKN